MKTKSTPKARRPPHRWQRAATRPRRGIRRSFTLSEPKCPPATIAGSSLESALVGPSWASALRRSARKSVRRVVRPSEAYLCGCQACATSRRTRRRHTPREAARQAPHVPAPRGISVHRNKWGPAALRRQPMMVANMNAMQRAPIHPTTDTHTLTQAPCASGDRASPHEAPRPRDRGRGANFAPRW